MIAESSTLFPVAFPSSSMSLSRWRQKNSGRSRGRMSTLTSWINPSIAFWKITMWFSLLATHYANLSNCRKIYSYPCMILCPHTVHCTSLLQLAQRRTECISALTRQQPAGERPRSGKGSVLRPSGFPSA